MKKILLFAIVFSLVISIIPLGHGFAQQSEPIVKVKLINFLGNKSEITLKPNGDYVASDQGIVLKSGNTYLLKQEIGKLSLYKDGVQLNSYPSFSIQPLQSDSQLSINNRLYLGSFDFVVENSQFVRPINSINMEDYLKGVVPIEMYPTWNIEALKTQAVAARTYATTYINRGIIDDTILYQVYGGYIWTPNSTKAVDETSGQVAQYNGRLIDAVYSASNGGATENNANTWGTASVPYLTIKQDPFDPKTAWNFSFHKIQMDLISKDLSTPAKWWSAAKETDSTISSNIKMWLNNNGYANKDIKITAIPDFSLHGIGSGGRVSKGNITVEFLVKDMIDDKGNLVPQRVSFSDVNASKVRSIIGTRMMWSYLVSNIQKDTDIVTVTGLGDGHGVGMSQWGAKNMADAGKKYDEILKFYYTGVTIGKIYEASLPTSIQPKKQVGWVKDKGSWSYFHSSGVKVTGWLKDSNKWYYLNRNGEMLTGWQAVGGRWYFFSSSGDMKTGWLLVNKKWYFLTSSGAMATGWILDKGKWYYLSSNGSMVQNRHYISGKWYLFHTSGYLIS